MKVRPSKVYTGLDFPFWLQKDKKYNCLHKGCGAKFNFHAMIDAGGTSTCPTCLRTLKFPHSWRKQAIAYLLEYDVPRHVAKELYIASYGIVVKNKIRN